MLKGEINMNCSKCNAPLQGHEAFCPNCGVFISIEEPMKPEAPTTERPVESSNSADYVSYPNTHSNTFHPQTAYTTSSVPPEIKKWNWGAFTFNLFWGIGNYNYLPLLCLIPFFNFIWVFVCGAKGNEWAWKSGKFNNVEDFLAVQETWNRAGFVSFIITLIACGVSILLFFLSFLTSAFFS